MLASQVIRFSLLEGTDPSPEDDHMYWSIGIVLAGCWLAALAVNGAWDIKSLGTSPSEYRRVTMATCAVIAGTAILSYLTRAEIARGYLALALPLGLTGLLLGRWVLRFRLRQRRRLGNSLNAVLVIGGAISAPAMAERLRRNVEAGYRVVGLCLPRADLADDVVRSAHVGGFPVLGSIDELPDLIRLSGADTVAVAASTAFGAEDIRRLGWQLEGTSVRLVLAPALTDVAGPRIRVEPVAGLPLVDIQAPTFRGPKLAAKITLDYVIAVSALLLLAPIFLATAAAILVTSGRPVFYRPERVGLAGKPFRLWRFRCMNVERTRFTPVGRVLRRLGLDRSLQLLNVVTGEMSMVGARAVDPRNQVLRETAVDRRIKLRPGITGPSQTVGADEVTSADRLQLDLCYVENWSIAGDLVILARAGRALYWRRWTHPSSELPV